MKIVGISGSLRQKSFNTGLITAMQKLASAEVTVELIDYREFPFYDQDVNELGLPKSVEQVAQQIQQADAIIIATPEYNYSVPGVLKNALDWLSRVPSEPFNGKPLAIIGASPSFMGTARAQMHLRQMVQYMNPNVLNRPEVLVTNAYEKFDEQGALHDEKTRQHLLKVIDALLATQ